MVVIVLIFLITAIQCTIFNCDFKKIYWGVIGIRYTCDFAYVKDTEPETALVEVQGKHMDKQSDADVEAIMVYNEKTLNRLPQDIGKFFPKLQALVWSHGNITSVVAEDIEQMKKLVILVLSHNKITSLGGDLFKNMPELLLIEFNNNLIEYVHKDCLINGKNLDSADFTENICVNSKAINTFQMRSFKTELPKKCSGKKETVETTTEKTPTDEL